MLLRAGSKMGAGDAGLEDIWHWDEDGPRISFKGPTGNSGLQTALPGLLLFLCCHQCQLTAVFCLKH